MKRSSFTPYCVYDAMGFIRILRIAAEQVDDIVRLLVWDTTKDYLHSYDVGVGQVGQPGGLNRYCIATANPVTEAAQFKRVAMDRGATPEAIRLLGLLAPVSEAEELHMAEKLKAKASADKATLKDAAKAAPVGGKKGAAKAADATTEAAPKAKGNTEALTKAREARAANAGKDRKYEPLVKAKDLTTKEGSWTHFMAKTIVGNKSTDAAKNAHKESGEYEGKSLDFTWAVGKELIKFKD